MNDAKFFTTLSSQYASYDLAKVLVKESKKLFNLKNSSFFLWKSANGEYFPRYQKGIDDLGDWTLSFSPLGTDNPLVEFLEKEKKYVMATLKGSHYEQSSKVMQEIGAEVSFPLFAHRKLWAIFNLGPKKNKKPFTKQEIALAEKLVKSVEDRLASTVLMEERAIFSAITAHDLHQPLKFSVPGDLDELISEKAGPLTDRQKELLAELQSEYEQLEKGFAKLFDLSVFYMKLIRSKQNWEKFDFVDCLREINNYFRNRIEQKGLVYEVQLPEESIVVYGDKENLGEVVKQLLDNAYKFTDQGKITMAVKKNNNSLEIELKDTGKGIEEDYLAGVLAKPFLQMDKLPDGHWPGLGLAKVKEILDFHQGTIKIESQVNQGTAVRVSLPIKK